MKDCSVEDHGTSLSTLHHTGTVGIDILILLSSSHNHHKPKVGQTCSGTQASTHFSRLSGHSLFWYLSVVFVDVNRFLFVEATVVCVCWRCFLVFLPLWTCCGLLVVFLTLRLVVVVLCTWVVVVVVVVVVVGILFKLNVVNNVENFTGVEAAFSTVCWRESKLVRVVNKVFVTGLEDGPVVGFCRGPEAGLVVVVDLGLGLETGVVVVGLEEDLVSAMVGVAALKLIVVLFLFLELFFLFVWNLFLRLFLSDSGLLSVFSVWPPVLAGVKSKSGMTIGTPPILMVTGSSVTCSSSFFRRLGSILSRGTRLLLISSLPILVLFLATEFWRFWDSLVDKSLSLPKV